uniref:Uncharacterized protein n=2 Tax=Aegilops tauschii subsp. strangulata TaxID=200361 RepID=A0A453MDY8_AEGTS
FRTTGYCSNFSGLSVAAPENLHSVQLDSASTDIQLHGVIWELVRLLRNPWLGVSYHGKLHTSYTRPDGIKGCSVDVFKSAISLLPYPVGCIFFISRWIGKSEIQ